MTGLRHAASGLPALGAAASYPGGSAGVARDQADGAVAVAQDVDREHLFDGVEESVEIAEVVAAAQRQAVEHRGDVDGAAVVGGGFRRIPSELRPSRMLVGVVRNQADESCVRRTQVFPPHNLRRLRR